MPVGGFSVGRDISLTVRSSSGILSLGLVTDFESKPVTSEVKILGLDGVVRNLVLPEGWMGTFTLTRQDSTLDDYWDGLEASYYSGLPLNAGIINETISEPSGLITKRRYTGVALKYDDAGTWSGNKAVIQKLGFLASRRISK